MIMARLDGRVALLTGGAKGIGAHYARALAAEGSRLMIADVADGKELAAALAREHGANSVASTIADVSDEGAVKALVAQTLDRFGKIDILVNNAALYAPLVEQPISAIDTALWDRVMAVNVRGVFLMTKYVSPHMIAQKYGKIINITSGTVARGIPNFAHYVSSKGAVMAFTRSVSRELGEHNICVNNLAPGFTLSDTVVNENPGHLDHSRAPAIVRRALKRDEYPQDLLGALVFLASKDSDFMTGQTVAIDGGATNN
jgi:NAD(P)-dependent dehydrogenase (short-subunit alcohol dehydrogenase family)